MGKGRTRGFTEEEVQMLKRPSACLSVRNIQMRTVPLRVTKIQKNYIAFGAGESVGNRHL